MEPIGDTLMWRAASHDSIMDRNSLAELLDQLDLILRALITSPNLPTVEWVQDKPLICGLHVVGKALKATSRAEGESGRTMREFSEEWTNEETSIRRILSVVSGMPEAQIQKQQTIYHLGLDSISAIKVSSLLRKEAIELSVNDLLQAPTIRDLATLAVTKSSTDGDLSFDAKQVLDKEIEGVDLEQLCSATGVDIQNVECMRPISPGQMYLLTIWQKTRGVVFQSTFEYTATSRLDKVRLEKAWRDLLSQCPILRSRFAATGQHRRPMVQLVMKDFHNGINWIDEHGSIKPACDRSHILPPMASLQVRLDSRSTLLRLQILHAYYDAVSLPLLITHLQSLYSNPDAEMTQPPRIDEFMAYTIRHSNPLLRRDFWINYLGSSPTRANWAAKKIEDDHQPARIEVFQSAVLKVDRLQDLASRKGVSIQALFLAAYALEYAYRVSDGDGHSTSEDQEVVIFGIYLANRSHSIERLHKLAIPTMNVVPLKVGILSGPYHLEAMAEQIRRDLREISSLQNSAVSLWEIDDWTGIKLDAFVNFIKLPDQTDVEEDGHGVVKEGEPVTFYPVDTTQLLLRRDGRQAVVPLSTNDFVEPIALLNNLVKNSYLVS